MCMTLGAKQEILTPSGDPQEGFLEEVALDGNGEKLAY